MPTFVDHRGQVAVRMVEVSWVSGFREFLLKTNTMALAIGVIIGVALGNVVNSLVNDLIMPPIGYVLGGIDFSQLKIVLKAAVGGDPTTEVAIRWGNFINIVIAFVVIAFVVYLIGRTFIKAEVAGPVKVCPSCKEANAVDASRCRACTSAI
jgi:large conductance mechanosensitive channel